MYLLERLNVEDYIEDITTNVIRVPYSVILEAKKEKNKNTKPEKKEETNDEEDDTLEEQEPMSEDGESESSDDNEGESSDEEDDTLEEQEPMSEDGESSDDNEGESSEESEGSDEEDDSSNSEPTQNTSNGTTILINKFVLLYDNIEDIMKRIEKVKKESHIDHSIINRVIDNFFTLQNKMYNYIAKVFSTKNYEENLLNYNYFVEAFKVNLALLEKTYTYQNNKQYSKK